MPKPHDEVLPGVVWGRRDWAFSPAFWQHLASYEDCKTDAFVCQNKTPLGQELAFCLLGGFGVRMELNQAAWRALLERGLLDVGRRPCADEIEAILREPLRIGSRLVRYRFPTQRSQRLAAALPIIEDRPPPTSSGIAFRDSLLRVSGIGPKTASWVARNWLGSDEVAILDVHVLRAGQIMGLFKPGYQLPRDYRQLETLFLDFARVLQVRPSLLDAIIWREMRNVRKTAKLKVAS